MTRSPCSCPLCGTTTLKVIYFGLPGRLCPDERCACLTGIAAYAPPIAGPNGFAFLTYEGSYWKALWFWLTGRVL